MRLTKTTNSLLLAPSDLTAHLACPLLTTLNRAVALGERAKPPRKDDPHLDLIREHGFAHEAGYLDRLKQEHGEHAVVETQDKLDPDDPDSTKLRSTEDRAADTIAAMHAGAHVIFQAAFIHNHWQGFADFLIRVDTPSALGDYSYEVVDTKLARAIKPAYIHQLAQYSLHVQRIQGLAPCSAHVVLGSGETESFALDDVLAFHRRAVGRLEPALVDTVTTFDPEPVDHCGLCNYEPECTAIWRARDDLHYVATLGRDNRAKLIDAGTETLAALSQLPTEPPPGELSETTFRRVRVQAELQLLTRETGELQRRHLEPERARGYARLPEPSPGDIFFDLEGDPFIGEHGIEYLWGYELLDDTGEPEYFVVWAHDEQQEQQAFEHFIDLVLARRAEYPGMHVYHYAPHELSTLRRLSEQYSTRIAEVDQLQRDGVLCDLYAVVRQGIQVGQESYSIKKLEPFYGFTRSSKVREGGGSIVAYEKWIEARDDSILDDIALYNSEDCTSTRLLRDWLLEMRDEAAAQFGVDFEELREPEDEDEQDDPAWVPAVQALQDELEAGLPEDRADDDADQAERRLLASLLLYHRREQKPQYWRFFELLEMTDEQLEGELDAVAGLVLDPAAEPVVIKQSVGRWLTFPAQEYKLSLGDVIDPATGARAGTIEQIENDRILFKRGKKPDAELPLPTALIGPAPIKVSPQREAIVRVAKAYLDGSADDLYPAIRALLRRELPAVDGIESGEPLIDGEVTVEQARRVTLGLQQTCLAVQGPPGAGKTYTGARMIVAALADGRRVAVSATSHKAIHNLISEVEKVAHAEGVSLNGIHKHSDTSVGSEYESDLGLIDSSTSNDDMEDPARNLVSGTPWLLSRPGHAGKFDLLVVDEAGQMSLADAVAIGGCAISMVLLGDQQQLPQVLQGTHPEGADRSVLQHVIGDHDRIPAERGLFLGTTWRMHPGVCEFISERFYEGDLHSAEGCEPQRIDAGGAVSGAGLRMLPVEHSGRSQYSPEEAAVIAAACVELLDGGQVTLREDGTRALKPEDILVVAPFNMAVREISAVVPDGVRVGTVDKFQGQEAPVVFYAMTSSSAQDTPRGLDFLFQPNRLNVAISRAQCLAVLVCSPRLLDAECNTLAQMRMVNHVCRYGEMVG